MRERERGPAKTNPAMLNAAQGFYTLHIRFAQGSAHGMCCRRPRKVKHCIAQGSRKVPRRVLFRAIC